MLDRCKVGIVCFALERKKLCVLQVGRNILLLPIVVLRRGATYWWESARGKR